MRKVRLVQIEYVATWIEDDGDEVNIVTGQIPAVCKAADLDALGLTLREQCKAHEAELNKGQPNRATRRATAKANGK